MRSRNIAAIIAVALMLFLQYLARAPVLGRADNALLLQQVDQLRCLTVADAQPPLQQRRRCALVLFDQPDRLRQQFVLLLHTQKLTETGGGCLRDGGWESGAIGG